jgi:hypothetical protein
VIGPGLSTFYVDSSASSGFAGAIKAFYTSLAGLFPLGLGITVTSTGDQIDSATGTLTGTWVDTATGAAVGGTNVSVFAQGVGMRAVWLTSGIVGGRRVRGSTFLCPIGSNLYDSNGTISGTTITGLLAAESALIAAVPTLRVWSRPTLARAGAASNVIVGLAPDRISWLRSRRT